MADNHAPSSPGMTAFAVAALTALNPSGAREQIRAAWRFIHQSDGENVIPGLKGAAPKTWPAAAPIIWALTGLRDPHSQPDQPVEVILLPPALRNKVSIALPVVLALGVMQARRIPRTAARKILGRIAEPRALAWLREASGTNGGIEECPMIAGFVFLGLHEAGVAEDLQLSSLCYLGSSPRTWEWWGDLRATRRAEMT